MRLFNPWLGGGNIALTAPDPNGNDTFDGDTSSYYTNGSDGTWTGWGSGKIIAPTSGATVQTISYNSFTDDDMFVEVDIDTARQALVCFRYQDNSNFFALQLSDDSGATPSSNFRIVKCISGSFSTIGSDANFTWTRGTPPGVCRIEITGTTVVSKLGGTTLQTPITSFGNFATGKVGLGCRGPTTGPNEFLAFRWGSLP